MIDFSVIIPQKNSIDSLPRLFATIPEKDNIEIIVADNNDTPVTKEEIGIDREYTLCWSSPKRFAGGARNEGMKHAHGKWLIFSDADDIFKDYAFETFESKKDSDADVVYFGMDGLFIETGERSDAGDIYTNMVKRYLANPSDDTNIRISFHSPCSKMVKREYVERNGFQYDEVIANNDDYFAMLVGYNAAKIEAVDKVVYTYIATHGSLMHRRSYDVIKARYKVILRKNKYLREHGLRNKQGSVAFFLTQSPHYGIKAMFEFFIMLVKYGQNPFVGASNWLTTIKKTKDSHNNDYISKK
jgi:glycosyltransferase involved in cell wall biosynthesis